MALDPEKLTTVDEARTFLANIKRLGRTDLHEAAFRRLCVLSGQDHTDPLVMDFWRAIAAAEEVLREQRGKTVRLSRTRQKIARVGVRKTAEDLALSKAPSDGFAILTEAGLGDLTAEYLVLKHSKEFSPDAIAAARKRLSEHGIEVPAESTS